MSAGSKSLGDYLYVRICSGHVFLMSKCKGGLCRFLRKCQVKLCLPNRDFVDSKRRALALLNLYFEVGMIFLISKCSCEKSNLGLCTFSGLANRMRLSRCWPCIAVSFQASEGQILRTLQTSWQALCKKS